MLEQAFKITFVNFLKRNNAYEKYLERLCDRESRLGSRDLDYMIKSQISKPRDIFLSSFVWEKKDKKIWKDLDNKWRDYCNSTSHL